MDNEMTYEQAMERLETLTRELEQGNVPIDKMAARLREAQTLLKQCRQQLYAADEAVKEILNDQPQEARA